MKLLIIIGLLGYSLNTIAETTTIKCWTNEDDVRECGSVVPPRYSKQGYEETNAKTGMTLKQVSAEKSPEEIKKLKALELEQARKKVEEEAQKRADQALMDTFPSVEDIDMARDAKLLSVAAAVKVAKNRILDYQRNLKATQDVMAQNKPEGDELVKIETYINQLNIQLEKARGIVVKKQQERDAIIKEYQGYKDRFYNIQSGN